MYLSAILSLSLVAAQALAAPTAETLNPISNVAREETHLSPRWEENYLERDSIPTDADDGLSERGTTVWKNTVCNDKNPYGWRPAITAIANSQIEELKTWKGIPSVYGKRCEKIIGDLPRRLSEIWLCNDNVGELRLQGYLEVADAAHRIIATCNYSRDVGRADLLASLGQQFAEGNWNVIVRGGY